MPAALTSLLGWFFLRSNFIKKLYFRTVHSRHRSVRVAGFTLVALVFTGRCARQFALPRVGVALAAVLAVLVSAAGAWSAALLPLGGIAWVAWRVSQQPGDGIGHRAGFEGYGGEHCENTVEGMRDLVVRDNAGQLPPGTDFPYLEFDVQETRDGQLVVFHDGALERAFPRGGANEGPLRELEAAGVDYETASAQDLTAAQLSSLHLAGRQGLRVPLLREFLAACLDAGIRRSLAVEVKVLVTDQGRRELIDSIRWYLDEHQRRLQPAGAAWQRQCYAPLGWAGVIAFPHFWAPAFGEFGSLQWRRWAHEFQRRGIPARACHFHDLSLIYGS